MNSLLHSLAATTHCDKYILVIAVFEVNVMV